MAEEKREKWLNYLALSTVILAVCATLSTFKGGGYSTRSLMNQSKASDQWSFYQSKSLKSYIFEMQSDNLELQKDLLANKDEANKYQDKINSYQSKIKQYEKDKADIKALAENFEKEEALNKEHSTIFGLAVIFLQISILLASISALIKQKLIWYLSMGIGCIGMFYFFDGFFLFLK